jgi:hypothetical protein
VFGADSNGRQVVTKAAAARVAVSMDEEERLKETVDDDAARSMECDPELAGVGRNHGQCHPRVALPTLRSARVCDWRRPGGW